MPALRTRRGRLGMTLIEIMITLVLLGIVSGVIMRVILRQQRFYQGVNSIMTQRGQLRSATSVLPVDLRSLSSVGNDIIIASDSSMEFMVNVGTSIVCEVIDGSKIAMPVDNLASGQILTSWYGYGPPAIGTTVYIYNDSSIVGNEDDRWQKFTMTAMDSSATRCLGAATFHQVADLTKRRPWITLSALTANDPVTFGPISQYIGVGAPVRFMKQVKYKLYQETDGKWYLGYADYNTATSAYGTLSPVSGPFDAYANSGSGFVFRYYDVDGTEIASGASDTERAKIARVDLVARARTAGNVKAAGIQNGANQQYRDSLAVSVMLRNRN
ncbi:MAG TPA: type II secretion system protein [Gemmatimonadaceae bacterium]|nr:type II secretion system protein [Gemmatimonadaceae bacterium]